MLSLSNVPMTLQQISIAIVDDDPGIGASLKRLLVQYGYRPLLFASAAECLRAMVRVEVACLLIDIQLGGDCGIELARKLSTMGVTSPIIHMSGANDDGIREAARLSGCAAFLDKPFSIALLVETIKKAIGQD
jgi:FixJ family two-component response regulator